MASRCGNVFTTTRLKSFLTGNVDEATRSQVRIHLATNQMVELNGVARYAQALKDTRRAGSRLSKTGAKNGKNSPKQQILEVDYSSPSDDAARDASPIKSAVHLL